MKKTCERQDEINPTAFTMNLTAFFLNCGDWQGKHALRVAFCARSQSRPKSAAGLMKQTGKRNILNGVIIRITTTDQSEGTNYLQHSDSNQTK